MRYSPQGCNDPGGTYATIAGYTYPVQPPGYAGAVRQISVMGEAETGGIRRGWEASEEGLAAPDDGMSWDDHDHTVVKGMCEAA
jgi:hypothetical protein